MDDNHQSQECISSGFGTSRQPSVPQVCCRWPDLSVQGPLLWPLHGPSGIHQGHGFCVSHTSRPGRPDTPASGRLVGPRLVQSGGPVGKKHGLEPVPAAWHCRQSGQVASHPHSLSHVSRDVHREALFEGFSLTGEGFNLVVTACLVSLLQATKPRCLAEPLWSSLLFLPSIVKFTQLCSKLPPTALLNCVSKDSVFRQLIA